VHDLQPVGILDPGDELLEELAGLWLGHLPAGDDIVEELPTGVLEHDDDVCGCRYNFIAIFPKQSELAM
jgi:hypothetical protein